VITILDQAGVIREKRKSKNEDNKMTKMPRFPHLIMAGNLKRSTAKASKKG